MIYVLMLIGFISLLYGFISFLRAGYYYLKYLYQKTFNVDKKYLKQIEWFNREYADILN